MGVNRVILAMIGIVMAGPAFAQGTAQQILDAHNHYRQAAGVPPLRWNSALAAEAQRWAQHLAATGQFDHGGYGNDEGQNLWEGTAGAYSISEMVGDWASEGRYYRSGIFPQVSTTGQWGDVGHYTQLIWRNTTDVGCGLARGGGNDVLACNYAPAGNVDGQPVK